MDNERRFVCKTKFLWNGTDNAQSVTELRCNLSRFKFSRCSLVWFRHSVWGGVHAGSNPAAPTSIGSWCTLHFVRCTEDERLGSTPRLPTNSDVEGVAVVLAAVLIALTVVSMLATLASVFIYRQTVGFGKVATGIWMALFGMADLVLLVGAIVALVKI